MGRGPCEKSNAVGGAVDREGAETTEEREPIDTLIGETLYQLSGLGRIPEHRGARVDHLVVEHVRVQFGATHPLDGSRQCGATERPRFVGTCRTAAEHDHNSLSAAGIVPGIDQTLTMRTHTVSDLGRIPSARRGDGQQGRALLAETAGAIDAARSDEGGRRRLLHRHPRRPGW